MKSLTHRGSHRMPVGERVGSGAGTRINHRVKPHLVRSTFASYRAVAIEGSQRLRATRNHSEMASERLELPSPAHDGYKHFAPLTLPIVIFGPGPRTERRTREACLFNNGFENSWIRITSSERHGIAPCRSTCARKRRPLFRADMFRSWDARRLVPRTSTCPRNPLASRPPTLESLDFH